MSARWLRQQSGLDASHLAERLGLFVMIVLGEAIVSVVAGLAEVEWPVDSALAAAPGVGVAFGLWWLYFDNLDEGVARRQRFAAPFWLLGHLPLVVGIVAAGIGVELVILTEEAASLQAPHRWLLCGSIALVLVALAAVHGATLPTAGDLRRDVRVFWRVGGAAVVLLVGAVGGVLAPIGLLAVLFGLGLVLVIADEAAVDEHAPVEPEGAPRSGRAGAGSEQAAARG